MNILENQTWDSNMNEQKEICSKYDSLWKPIDKNLKIGISENINSFPINGLRHKSESGTTGWYIWSGEYSENADFFKPLCAEHLLDIKPEIIKYLGLDIGFRFLIGENDYEDIWFDKNIKEI